MPEEILNILQRGLGLPHLVPSSMTESDDCFLWNNHGGPAMLTRKDDGNIQLVIAPGANENEKEES